MQMLGPAPHPFLPSSHHTLQPDWAQLLHCGPALLCGTTALLAHACPVGPTTLCAAVSEQASPCLRWGSCRPFLTSWFWPPCMQLTCRTRLPAAGLTQSTLPRALQLGVSEKTVLRAFHKDAMDLHDVCQDLERVCKELQDPNIRAKRRVSGDSSSGLGTVLQRCLPLRQPAQGA